METLHLAPALHMGIELIDQQHGRFFELMNSLFEADVGDEHRSLVAGVLAELSDYVKDHFDTEEELMTRFEYDELEAHQALHAKFVAEVIEFEQKYVAGKIGLEDELLGSMVDWFTKHVMQEDMKYRELFRAKGL